MADIVSAEAIRYVNEQIRPLAEAIRALKARVDASLTTYNAGVGTVFYNNAADPIMDGREAEGVSRLTGNDILLFVTQMIAFQTQLNGVGVANVISKPCVRPLEAV
jgi:hypothetical protein